MDTVQSTNWKFIYSIVAVQIIISFFFVYFGMISICVFEVWRKIKHVYFNFSVNNESCTHLLYKKCGLLKIAFTIFIQLLWVAKCIILVQHIYYGHCTRSCLSSLLLKLFFCINVYQLMSYPFFNVCHS